MDRFDKAYKAVKSVCGAILSKLDYNDGDMLYEQMESQILEVLGGGPGAHEVS